MRQVNTLTFNEESWLIQPNPTNPINLNIFKNGINIEYFLETITGNVNIGEPAGTLGYKLNQSNQKIHFIKDLFDTEINFNLMADVITAIQIQDKKEIKSNGKYLVKNLKSRVVIPQRNLNRLGSAE